MEHYPQWREIRGFRYLLLEPIHPDRARFIFTGPYEGEEIRWNTLLQRLDDRTTHSSIEIGDDHGEGRRLTVTLAIPEVDEPAILRTVVMIRQYKRLRPGRHEFGGTAGP